MPTTRQSTVVLQKGVKGHRECGKLSPDAFFPKSGSR